MWLKLGGGIIDLYNNIYVSDSAPIKSVLSNLTKFWETWQLMAIRCNVMKKFNMHS